MWGCGETRGRGPVTSQRRSGIIRNNLYVSRSISEVSGSRGPLLYTFLRYLIPNILIKLITRTTMKWRLEPTTRFAQHQDNLTFRISDLITCLCFLNVWLSRVNLILMAEVWPAALRCPPQIKGRRPYDSLSPLPIVFHSIPLNK